MLQGSPRTNRRWSSLASSWRIGARWLTTVSTRSPLCTWWSGWEPHHDVHRTFISWDNQTGDMGQDGNPVVMFPVHLLVGTARLAIHWSGWDLHPHVHWTCYWLGQPDWRYRGPNWTSIVMLLDMLLVENGDNHSGNMRDVHWTCFWWRWGHHNGDMLYDGHCIISVPVARTCRERGF